MLGTIAEPEYLLGVEPIFPGLIVSFFLFLFFNLKNKT